MATDYMPKLGRIPIRFLSPQQPENRWPAKAYRGEVVPFAATVFREGHDQLGVQLQLTAPDGSARVHRMLEASPGTDRWQVPVLLDAEGVWTWRVRAFADDWASWHHNAAIKIPAGVDVELMLELGAGLLARAPRRAVVQRAAALLASGASAAERWAALDDPRLAEAIASRPIASLETVSETLTLRVERERSGVGAWYEFFPRSEGAHRSGDGAWASGTFRTAAKRLPGVAAMGFDVVYLPPIHPIGVTGRKGPNNSLTVGPHDPGSPWAIGSASGGHDAIHPDLGDEKDFAFFLGAAKRAGLEVAIDLALQASPDHPWVREHPEWFNVLPDGSIAYAENPPKKYQDIYPLNFDRDPEGIRAEVSRIIRHWIDRGIRIFRVDNPHTKPLQFWEVLLHEMAVEFPDVVFLAEAFTRPAMLHALAQAGFQQSYTYFTWRNTKPELEEFLTGLATETDSFLRPNLFVNTPDILTEFLQFGGAGAYRVRAAIAATASPTWGVYAGYELFENVARPGSEENIDNEKYEYKPRDWAGAEKAGRSLAPYLAKLNAIRAAHPALRQLRNLRVHYSDDEAILVYSKVLDAAFNDGTPDQLVVIANLDPHAVRETMVHLELSALGLHPDDRFEAVDLITGQRYDWARSTYVRLDPFAEPVHILHVQQPGRR